MHVTAALLQAAALIGNSRGSGAEHAAPAGSPSTLERRKYEAAALLCPRLRHTRALVSALHCIKVA